jgi:Ca2+-binding RTX toxin-like protein
MRRGPRLLLVAAVLALATVGLATPASALSCTVNAAQVAIDVGAGETAVIAQSNSAITLNGAPCGTATVTTIDTIAVSSSGPPQEVAIDLTGGPFAPGMTDEGDGGSEIEFTVAMPSGTFRIVGSNAADQIVIGAGGINLNASETTGDPDVVITGSPQLALLGGDGNDFLSVGGGNGTGAVGPAATIAGQAGNDRIGGGIGGGQFDGGDGADEADYAGAVALTLADLVSGVVTHSAGGVDMLVAIEDLTGSPGDDVIHGNDQANVLDGAAGADVIVGGLGDDTIDGGPGGDTLDFSNAAAGIFVDLGNNRASGEGTDTVQGIENVVGSQFDDNLTGDAEANILAGGAGNDTIDGGDEDDTLLGGDDVDTVSFASSSTSIDVDLGKGTASGAGADTLDGFENVAGSKKADTITGTKLANTLDGKNGADAINGAKGADDVLGGNGNDVLGGGNDNDIIKGGNGKDQLNGGKGTHDICKGGADPDSFVNCENFS